MLVCTPTFLRCPYIQRQVQSSTCEFRGWQRLHPSWCTTLRLDTAPAKRQGWLGLGLLTSTCKRHDAVPQGAFAPGTLPGSSVGRGRAVAAAHKTQRAHWDDPAGSVAWRHIDTARPIRVLPCLNAVRDMLLVWCMAAWVAPPRAPKLLLDKCTDPTVRQCPPWYGR